MTRLRRARKWLVGVAVVAGAAMLVAGCGTHGVSITAAPSPVPCSEAGADTSSAQLRSELGSYWRYRAFLMAQLMSRGVSAASDALVTNSAEIALVFRPGFGDTQANIADSQLAKNSDLMAAYFKELSGGAHPSSLESQAGEKLTGARQSLEAGIAEFSDFLWLLTSAPRMVLRSLLTEQVRLVAEGQAERAIGLGTEIGDLLALAFHRSVPEKYPASPETPAATARSRREAGLDGAIYIAFSAGTGDSLPAGLSAGAYDAAVTAIQAKNAGNFELAYSLLGIAIARVRSEPPPANPCDEGTH